MSAISDCGVEAAGWAPMDQADDVGQEGFTCPEDLEQAQKGQPETGLRRKGTAGRRGWREGGCCKREEVGGEGGGAGC